MKILTAGEMRAADAATYAVLGIPSRAVMESAGREVAAFLLGVLEAPVLRGTVVLCGKGNNGGDGYVVARTLLNHGLLVSVAALTPLAELRGDARSAAEAFQRSGGEVHEWSGEDPQWLLAVLETCRPGVVVDAILGTGVSGAVREPLAGVLSQLNSWSERNEASVVAVDLPSGVDADRGEVAGAAIHADVTVSLQALKPAHVLFPAADLSGEVFVAEIGVGAALPEFCAVRRELLRPERLALIARQHPLWHPAGHKGTRGHVLVVAGGPGTYGAAKLSATAALRAGCGLVTLAIPASVAPAVFAELHEVMGVALPDDDGAIGTVEQPLARTMLERKRVMLIGPGCGGREAFRQSFAVLLREAAEQEMRVVIDADGLTALAADPQFLHSLPAGLELVLTPHPGEMARLLGSSAEAVQAARFESALEAARRFGATVVLKGAYSVIADAGGFTSVSPVAHTGLGTGGSGDVLGGIIASLLAADLPVRDAVELAVVAHAAAAELLENEREGRFGTLAGDIGLAAAELLNRIASSGEQPVLAVIERVLPGIFGELPA